MNRPASDLPKTVAPRISPETSEMIRISRVICILAVVYVHTPPYGGPLPIDATPIRAMLWFVTESLGRSSVPLLSVLSAYLLVRLGENTRAWHKLLRKKFKSLLVPLLAWNTLAIALSIVAGKEDPAIGEIPDQLFAFTKFPALNPLYFLRDIFIATVTLPLFIWLMRWPGWALCVLLLNSMFDLDGSIFLSNFLPFFFAVGIGIGIGRLSVDSLRKYRISTTIAACIALSSVVSVVSWNLESVGENNALFNLLGLIQRMAGAVIFWSVAGHINRRFGSGSFVARLEPMIFFVFCAHPIVIAVVWKLVEAAGGTFGTLLHAVFFLTAPAWVLVGAVSCVLALELLAPQILKVLMGGRLPNILVNRKSPKLISTL